MTKQEFSKTLKNNDMKTFNLPFSKVTVAISYSDVQILTSFDNLKSLPSTSQMTKRMDYELFEEVLEALKNGEEVEIH